MSDMSFPVGENKAKSQFRPCINAVTHLKPRALIQGIWTRGDVNQKNWTKRKKTHTGVRKTKPLSSTTYILFLIYFIYELPTLYELSERSGLTWMGAKVVTHLHGDFRQNSHVPSETSGLKGNCDWTWFNFQGEHINLWQLFIHLEKKSLSRNCTLQSQLEDKAWRRQANKEVLK